jgi:CMP-N-acetylneuraminic acid synthetase
MRPEEYSHDTASSTSVVEHAINYLSQKEGQYFDVIVLLQPSSPFRTAKHITEAVNLFIDNNAEAVVSVCLDVHKYSIGELPNNMSISDVIKDSKINFLSNLKSYRLNGAIYICKTDSFMVEKSFFISKNSFAYEMDSISSIDIDEMIDLFFAEAILKERARNGL